MWIYCKIEGRYMKFDYIFLSTRKFNVTEINFNWPFIMTEWHMCWGKCLPSSSSNRDGKFNVELYIDWLTAVPTDPQRKIQAYQMRVLRVFYFIFSIYFHPISITFDSLFSTTSTIKLNKYASIFKYSSVS